MDIHVLLPSVSYTLMFQGLHCNMTTFTSEDREQRQSQSKPS